MNKKWAVVLQAFALLAVLALAGCYAPTDYPKLTTTTQYPPAEPLAVQRRIVAKSVQNRPIMCTVLGRGPDVTFVMATIHGNEPAGTPLVRRPLVEAQVQMGGVDPAAGFHQDIELDPGNESLL